MREYQVPAVDEVADDESLSDAVFDNAEKFPDTVSFRRKHGEDWSDVTAAEFAEQVTSVARGLIASGVEHGDRVSLLSRTRFEWTVLDYAIAAVGATTVPIYQTSSPDQIEWILSDSGAVAVIIESDEHRDVVHGLRDRLTSLRHVWQIEPTDGGTPAVEHLVAEGASVDAEQVGVRRAAVRADDLATLIYTSGTTGRPKGCELTHRNLLTELKTAGVLFGDLMNESASLLLFLPLAHVLAKIIQCGGVHNRTTIGHVSDTANLLADLAAFRPTFVLSVPRVFEKVFNSAQQKAHSSGKGAIFDAAASTAEEWSRAQPSPGLVLSLKHALFDRLVYGKLRAALGGRCVAAVSGGAPLGERLGHFFRGVGLPVYEGYGLTETSGGITVNTPDAQRIGTVGRPLAGSAVRIAEEDGEILVRGDLVFRGYWHNPEATEEATSDGWFRTGDIGDLDEDGFLRITGRKKELIVTAGGKNVAPAVLEDRLRSHPLVSQCMVVGDNQPFIGALVTLDPEALPAWRTEHGKPAPGEPGDPSDLVTDPDLLAEIDLAVKDANQAVSHAEGIKKFRVLAVDFTEAGGELTPTLKLKRNVVTQTYADDIAALYDTAGARR
ncbi:AMP-dependent synthetase/ligase [Pseudonocardia spinosispora]|uniref:AMP-dependent synthetase/ligase n=1 Tax=Pseudonocardia spinosispora TaxID=103441 RepID=UPI0004013765|nr:long-chain fatty acid--CoA ligase [Pseudonocardia spinosispora]